MVKKLGLTSLKTKRIRGDLIEVFKTIKPSIEAGIRRNAISYTT